MKKMKTVFTVAFATLMLVSCAKDYTCTCTAGSYSVPAASYHATKKDAKASCDTYAATYSAYGVSCSLN